MDQRILDVISKRIARLRGEYLSHMEHNHVTGPFFNVNVITLQKPQEQNIFLVREKRSIHGTRCAENLEDYQTYLHLLEDGLYPDHSCDIAMEVARENNPMTPMFDLIQFHEYETDDKSDINLYKSLGECFYED